MKHFGAVLAGDNNIVDGGESSILTISGASGNDKIIIYNQNDAATASEYSGGAITGDALTTDSGPSGLVIVPSVAGRGATHLLGADGREVAITDVGGGVNTNLFVPISNETSFVDSEIRQSSTAAGDITITLGSSTGDTVVVSGNLQVNGTTTTVNSTTVDVADQYITLANTALTADKSTLAGGIFVEQTVADTAGTQVVTYAGLRVGVDGQWEVTSDATTDDGTTGTWIDLGLATGGIQSITGANGITANDVSTAQTTSAISLDVAITATGVSSSTVNGGGLSLDGSDGSQTLGIDFGGISAGQLATSIASTRTGLANGTAGQVLLSQGNGGFAWGTNGDVTSYIHRATKAAATTFIKVAQTDHGFPAIGAETDTGYTISVFEEGTVGIDQIIPERVFVADQTVSAGSGNGVPGDQAAVAGDIFILLGATTDAMDIRVVVKA